MNTPEVTEPFRLVTGYITGVNGWTSVKFVTSPTNVVYGYITISNDFYVFGNVYLPETAEIASGAIMDCVKDNGNNQNWMARKVYEKHMELMEE